MPLTRLLPEKFSQTSYRLLILTIVICIIVSMPACKKNDGASTTGSVSNTPTGATPNSSAPGENGSNLFTPESALEQLMKGNERFSNNNLRTREFNKEKLAELAKGQKPFAIVLACSDALVSPELLFDQSVGDLFIIRVAGNIADKAAIGSIEYAAEQFKSPLIFILGEEKCGAVTAATTGQGANGSIQFLVNEIKPAVAKAKGLGGDLIAKSVDENVRHVVDTLPGKSAMLTQLIKDNKIKIAGGTYSISSGKVSIVSEL